MLGDLTTNHTGVGHEWFGRAQADPESVEAGFYLFSEHPGEYHSWLGHSSLPSLNYTSQELRERIYEGDDAVVGRWLDAGLDGWRIDVANMTGRQGGHQYTREVAQGIRRAIARVKPEAWLLAENFFDAADDLVGESWHGVMDYLGATFPIWRWLGAEHQEHKPMSPLPASEIVATMREVHSRYPWDAVTSSTVHLDSHDLPRFRTIAGAEDHGGVDDGSADGGLARTRHLIGAALQFTLPGVPALFAGDELGLTGANGEHSRTPMPWEHPESWDRATVDGYRELIGLRQEHAALRRGSLRWLSTGEDHLTFVREHPAGRILVHVVRPRPDGSEPPAEPVRLPAAVLGGSAEATTVRGESLTVVDGGWQLPTAVGAHLWRVDGSDLAWESSGL